MRGRGLLLLVLPSSLALSVLVAPAASADARRPSSVSVTADPGLTPAFRTTRSDYVVRCTDAPVRLQVDAPPGTKVQVGTSKPRSGAFEVAVPLVPGQAFSLTVLAPGQVVSRSWVRCLPRDFPSWTATRSGTPQAAYYVMSVLQSHYAIVVDDEGVPVWWRDTGETAGHVQLVEGGHLLWATLTESREVDLSGRDVVYLPRVAGGSDLHDTVKLPDGDYLILQYVLVDGVDRSAWGLPPGGVMDAQLKRRAPDGRVLWSWSALDHIPLEETPPSWRSGGDYPDAFHINSAEAVGDSYVLSFRHLDALYSIDATTGEVEWKLGGSPRAESLTGASFSGQHDARVLPDGTLTLHDNGTQNGQAPRAARYRLAFEARTATLVEEVRDTAAPSSFCCGSARRLPGGDWVMAWGGTQQVAELDATGAPVLRLVMAGRAFPYRALPVLPGVVTPAQLREGMDAQAP